MAVPSKYQAKEVLNKVLNAGEDALNVDLSDSVTVTVDSEFPAAAALADDSGNPTTTSVGSHLLGYDSGNTNWNRVEVDDVGHLQIDVLSITAGDNNIGNVDIASALPAGSNTIGVVDLGSTDNAVLDAMAASLALLDNSISSGNELQVDVVAALPTGSNTIGVVNLSATDNAVLDTIDAVLDTIKTDTGTIDADTNAINTATVASQAALEKMLYGNALVITAIHGSGSTQDLSGTYEALYVGVGGDVVVTMVGTGNFTFKNVASGQLLPIRITHVVNTNTTATNMIALKA